MCYRSWEPGLNPNVRRVRNDQVKYLENILSMVHGSVLEHASFTFVLHNVSRVFSSSSASAHSGNQNGMPSSAAGPCPGVVVVHDALGMTADLRRQADRLAVGGHLALAPDLWHGRAWPLCIRSAFRQVMTGSGPVFEEIDAAAAWLAGQEACTAGSACGVP
jgi:hypothetical protein